MKEIQVQIALSYEVVVGNNLDGFKIGLYRFMQVNVINGYKPWWLSSTSTAKGTICLNISSWELQVESIAVALRSFFWASQRTHLVGPCDAVLRRVTLGQSPSLG